MTRSGAPPKKRKQNEASDNSSDFYSRSISGLFHRTLLDSID